MNWQSMRERLAQMQGHSWRSLAELAETSEFQALLQREFPQDASQWQNPVSRRRFLQLMGASLALAGLTACTRQARAPDEQIIPYVKAPERLVPGKPLFFATAFQLMGFAQGVLVESHMGRPTKIEGNPDHPASLGATNALAQASILTLYDPDRSQTIRQRGRIATWEDFQADMIAQMQTFRATEGAGLRILTETVTSPTLAAQIESLLEELPQARWYQYEPVNRDNLRRGAELAFGQDVNTIYRFDQAQRILALDADFLLHQPGSLRYARQFIDQRRMGDGSTDMNRLYVVESSPTLTGAMADHRQPILSTHVIRLALAVARRLGIDVGTAASPLPEAIPESWIAAVAADLLEARGSSIVLAGREQPPEVHALAHAMNEELDNVGQTVIYTPPVESSPSDQEAGLRELVQEMQDEQVAMLVIIGGNPVYTAPVDLAFAEALEKVALRIHQSLYVDETSRLCQWHIPQTHNLETWGDARAFDGTATIIQPLIDPLYDAHSAHELLAVLQNQPGQRSYELVRRYWENQYEGDAFLEFWQTALHDGLVAGSSREPVTVTLRPGVVVQLGDNLAADIESDRGLEINFRTDSSIWDGRFANNGWLQELPRVMTTITWDNVVLISPTTAERLALANEDVVELRYRGRRIFGPIWILPGQADNAVTIHLGYGRSAAGSVGTGVGFNAYQLRTADAPWFDRGLELHKTGERYALAPTQDHFSLEGRDFVKVATLAEFRENPAFVHESGTEEELPSLYPEFEYPENAWGMAIDLNACIGCNACTIACQAENNIPVVGKDEVIMGREMHWLKVDRYYEGTDLANPAIYFQPRPCMHCEKAPCEVVCPVAATVHDSEGLNAMVYNRCVGTRYCSNNCPYKVRRFNFLQYAERDIPVIQLGHNPDVTVRVRGVMEKCTYCVQRISAARIAAKKEERPIRDGEILTACQQACPTQAIVFGDINNADSLVAQLKAQPRNYGLLAELGTRPRTSYLARLRNPNPEIGVGDSD